MIILGGNRSPIEFVRIRTRFHSVYGVSAQLEPRADLLQALDGRLGNVTFRSRSDIQQIISVLAGDIDQLADQGLRGFPVECRWS